jgi:hypothetical protein
MSRGFLESCNEKGQRSGEIGSCRTILPYPGNAVRGLHWQICHARASSPGLSAGKSPTLRSTCDEVRQPLGNRHGLILGRNPKHALDPAQLRLSIQDALRGRSWAVEADSYHDDVPSIEKCPQSASTGGSMESIRKGQGVTLAEIETFE